MLQILRKLVTQGVLCSTRGVEGGYYLARPADQITLLDIVEAFENPLEPHMPDLDGLQVAVRERLLLTLRDVSAAARAELAKLTMGDLLRVNELPGGDDGQPQVTMFQSFVSNA